MVDGHKLCRCEFSKDRMFGPLNFSSSLPCNLRRAGISMCVFYGSFSWEKLQTEGGRKKSMQNEINKEYTRLTQTNLNTSEEYRRKFLRQ